MMVRPRISIPFVPLKHLVFETALALEMERADGRSRALSLPRSMATSGLAVLSDPPDAGGHCELDHVSTGPTNRTNAVLAERDKQYAAAVASVIQGYRMRGTRVRVCDALTEAGCWEEYRHDRKQFPRLSAVVLELRGSVVSARQIGG